MALAGSNVLLLTPGNGRGFHSFVQGIAILSHGDNWNLRGLDSVNKGSVAQSAHLTADEKQSFSVFDS
ncbi:hypothetical protein T02_8242 [Trichinella nativa]|uniref:Uncharacterized protein n=1 Tax=Trichinella nativa TaxID=6335 RepID=A0A0V1LEC3_9BILA|nr:hypothetical protein T02_8242 [Trichinella nativa]